MKLILRAHQLKLTDSLKTYAEQKLLAPLQKLINTPATKLTVDLSHDDTPKNNVNKKCRVRVSIPHLNPIHISEIDENMYIAIDKAHHSIVRQVKRQQKRAISNLRKAS
tara:strand:+ start:986 stop:1312 length:327 start_codon:yes stop_codon:yes gene_type:complete